MSSIWDFRDFDGSNIFEQDIKRIAQSFEDYYKIHNARKTAFVAPGDLAFGLSRMFESYAFAVPSQIEIFRDYDEAMEWVLKKDNS